ncbi:MAG: hypothetical protein A2Y62_01605 [Candidatus Fischerbacteria bacterium RBG_13_37_8]|uniref:Uncharacterized protein n=1 Tax=Candidatus Fischerbacteria bacterium RBG_13_37_8 TaxID=1817863 RepID=A0A1F5VTX1_9BACT|nr:MAG: hypothetical protein A2Y62_01605 [Candidatus Fischerbacteria bacterium RBG_13_37_8]
MRSLVEFLLFVLYNNLMAKMYFSVGCFSCSVKYSLNVCFDISGDPVYAYEQIKKFVIINHIR